ncbi:MAG: GrlR family regulatory protein [Pseudomonadota bacterium]
MIEALWSVSFESNFGLAGHGIAVFESGRVLGGDSGMMYVGSYEVKNSTLEGTIHVTRYANPQGMVSVVGLDDFHLQITGKPDAKVMNLTGFVVEAPERQIAIQAIRRAELP